MKAMKNLSYFKYRIVNVCHLNEHLISFHFSENSELILNKLNHSLYVIKARVEIISLFLFCKLHIRSDLHDVTMIKIFCQICHLSHRDLNIFTVKLSPLCIANCDLSLIDSLPFYKMITIPQIILDI